MSSKPINKITKLLFLRIKPININQRQLGHIKIIDITYDLQLISTIMT